MREEEERRTGVLLKDVRGPGAAGFYPSLRSGRFFFLLRRRPLFSKDKTLPCFCKPAIVDVMTLDHCPNKCYYWSCPGGTEWLHSIANTGK